MHSFNDPPLCNQCYLSQYLHEDRNYLVQKSLNEALGMRYNEACPENFHCSEFYHDSMHPATTMTFSIHLGFNAFKED